MKMYSLKCPDCGGELDFEDGRPFIFCKYCGRKILIEESDEIKLAKIERDARLEERRMNDKSFNRGTLVLLGILAVFLIIALTLTFTN